MMIIIIVITVIVRSCSVVVVRFRFTNRVTTSMAMVDMVLRGLEVA